MSKLIIKNATVVDAVNIYKANIIIENEKIKSIHSIEENIKLDNYAYFEIIDAEEKYVMPGAIDVHTHLNIDVGIAKSVDDFKTGAIAAACGGTTTIVDHMGFGKLGCTLQSRLDEYHKYADGLAVVDYSFHGVLQHIDNNILKEMETLTKNGITSFKFYMTYGFKFDDTSILKALKKAKEIGAILCVHAENNDTIEYLKKYYIENEKTTPIYHALSRREEAEAEAVNRVIDIATIAENAPIYIVHITTGKGLKHIEKAIEENKNVFAETCPQYLLLDEDYYNKENYEGLKYIMSPPLRKKYNQEKLWGGLKNGSISTIATDHCSFDFETKLEMGKNDFTKCPNGFPGIESRVELIFSEGVMKNKISINKFVEVISTNPAKLFGLYPKKGSITVGADADFIIIDKNKKHIIKKSNLHENVDYAGYEGFEVNGKITHTILRGKVIYKDGQFLGSAGYGNFIKRANPILER